MVNFAFDALDNVDNTHAFFFIGNNRNCVQPPAAASMTKTAALPTFPRSDIVAPEASLTVR
jgi:hypothetical protein